MHFTYGDPDRSTDPQRALPGARSLVVGARSYRRSASGAPFAGAPVGSIARYSWQDHYRPLHEALSAVASHLQAAGWRTRVLVDDNAMVDREAARRAGLGWYGKNTLLLIPGRGSWFVLGSVVTDAPLDGPADLVGDQCGACTRCLAACPTGALIAPGILDARRCLAWLLEAPGWFPTAYRASLGGRIYGCDACQEACPPNRAAERHHPSPSADPDDQPQVDLVEMLDCSDSELLERFGRWYIPRRQARYLRRNALVALGNVGDGNDARVVAALEKALFHPDPVVRGHAVWASAELGRGDLLAPLWGAETDPEVRAELEATRGLPQDAELPTPTHGSPPV